jgi:hypothetical protein
MECCGPPKITAGSRRRHEARAKCADSPPCSIAESDATVPVGPVSYGVERENLAINELFL